MRAPRRSQLRSGVAARDRRRRIASSSCTERPQRAPARVVPVHLAQIARQSRADLLEHRQRFLAIATRGDASGPPLLPARPGRRACARPTRAGRPRGRRRVASSSLRARRHVVAGEHRDARLAASGERSVSAALARARARARAMRTRASAARFGRWPRARDEHALEPRLGGVDAAAERLVGSRAGFVGARGLSPLARERGKLRFEALRAERA